MSDQAGRTFDVLVVGSGASGGWADGTAPLLTGVPLIPEGEVVQGTEFPLLT